MYFGKESKEQKVAFLDPLRKLPVISVSKSNACAILKGGEGGRYLLGRWTCVRQSFFSTWAMQVSSC